MTSISDLPPELLWYIASRLRTAVDVVRFHAVCREWRDTLHYLPPQPDPLPALLPWLLAPSKSDDDPAAGVACHCVFSKTSYHAPGLCIRDRRVAHADGTGSWLSLDGVTWYPGKKKKAKKQQKIGNWIPQRLGAVDTDRCCAVAYHRGATVCVDLAKCYIHEKHFVLNHKSHVKLPDEPGKVRQCSYLLECRGELLLGSVLQDGGGRRLSVSVHALDLDAAVDTEPPPRPAWERRDGALGNHVLFLGYPGSFAVEAARFGGDVAGGSAYFVLKSEPCRVCRYSFEDDGTAATLVETLPAGWNDERCMWFLPNPEIEPITARRETGHGRTLPQEEEQAPGSRRRRDLTIYAGDLCPGVDSSQLQKMFSKHGKVLQARVAYDKRGRSREFGFVTMATQKGFDKAIARQNAVKKPKPKPQPANDLEIICTLCFLALLLFFAYYITARICCIVG
ncbi:hypothetical protein E2562_013147 [Oryza meyeriana var. granulata]|uniref:RRM domain-containing protein n=1 Tax=Oryza meyeriana var. granulata TaxID=110450 RepID=A0A6G1F7Y2_9ORYZ|nr:hypothetical protein E2562_013147 [Oryza meyeriana var. granulata]